MGYKITDRFHFGKYEGFTIEEVFYGQKYISQQLINDFLFLKLNNLKFSLQTNTPGIADQVEVKNLKILMNNKISFDLELNIE